MWTKLDLCAFVSLSSGIGVVKSVLVYWLIWKKKKKVVFTNYWWVNIKTLVRVVWCITCICQYNWLTDSYFSEY